MLTLVIDHNPNFEDPSVTVKNICQSLAITDKVKNGKMKMPKIITARRQPPNLLRILSLSKKRDHSTSTDENDGKYIPCKDPRCETCPAVIKAKTYVTKNETVLKRNAKMSCKSRDLLYLLICKTCRGEYCGETGVYLNLRTNLHRNQIEDSLYRKMKVSHHIHRCGKDDFEIFPFLKFDKNCHIYREEMEKHFREIIKPKLH